MKPTACRTTSPLILGSASPRRHQILTMLGIPHHVRISHASEAISPAERRRGARKWPELLAVRKALSLSLPEGQALVLGVDTMVFLDRQVMGKPRNAREGLRMLRHLRGRTHVVVTGVALAQGGRLLATGSESTRVTFAPVAEADLKDYACSAEPRDKAGSYAIQGRGSFLVSKINGCYYNVMGLPIQLTLDILRPWLRPGVGSRR